MAKQDRTTHNGELAERRRQERASARFHAGAEQGLTVSADPTGNRLPLVTMPFPPASPGAGVAQDRPAAETLHPTLSPSSGEPVDAGGSISSPYDQLPILDATIHDELRLVLPRAVLSELYALCIQQTLQRAAQIRGDVRKGNLRAVVSAAHAISGSAAMLGAARVAALAQQVQSFCVARTPSHAGSHVPAIHPADAHHPRPEVALEICLTQLIQCCHQLAHTLALAGLAQ